MGLKSLLFPCVVLAMSMRVASNSITGSLQNMSGSEVNEDNRLLQHPKLKKCAKACEKKDLDCVKHTNTVHRHETCGKDQDTCYACCSVGNYTHADCCANPDLIQCKKAWGATSAVETIYPTPAPTVRVQKKVVIYGGIGTGWGPQSIAFSWFVSGWIRWFLLCMVFFDGNLWMVELLRTLHSRDGLKPQMPLFGSWRDPWYSLSKFFGHMVEYS